MHLILKICVICRLRGFFPVHYVSVCHKEIAFDLMSFFVLLMFLLNWQIFANFFSDFRLELIDSDIMLSCSCCKNIIF